MQCNVRNHDYIYTFLTIQNDARHKDDSLTIILHLAHCSSVMLKSIRPDRWFVTNAMDRLKMVGIH